MDSKAFYNDWKIILFLCLTLGLAPFSPPHIYDKLQWLYHGGEGFKLMDFIDILFHGFPFILLIRKTLFALKR